MLHDRDADSLLNGHAYRYERLAPIRSGGRQSAQGIHQIVAGIWGTGGRG
jgi:hypothetical protein